MSDEHPRSLPTHGPMVQASCIVLPDIRPQARRYLEAHGCLVRERISYVLVRYPTGATSQERYPRTGYSRHIITLPDGTLLEEARPALSLFANAPNCLYLPKEAENA